MDSIINIPWTSTESKSALAVRLQDEEVASQLETADADTWGFFRLPNGKVLVVGYADIGLLPMAALVNERLVIGIDELLVGYDVRSLTLAQAFLYHMPSIFHEFISMTRQLIVRDELGFVGISLDGAEQWKHLANGPIDKFRVDGNSISGSTIDGERFSFVI
jgi:hypothetical protein